MDRWEYGLITWRVESKLDVWHYEMALQLGAAERREVYKGVATGAPSILKLLNDVGADGWELVGPPITENASLLTKTNTDFTYYAGRWIHLHYYLRRKTVRLAP